MSFANFSVMPEGNLLPVAVAKAGGNSYAAMWLAGREGELQSKELKQPYKDSIWLHAGCKLITSQITRVPLEWYADDARTVPAEDPKRDAWWKMPALRCGGKMQRSDTLEALGVWLLLSGEANVVLGDDWISPRRGAELSPFIVAKPHKLRPIMVRHDDELIGWEYTDGEGRKHLLIPEQVVRSVAFNPYDDCRGLGDYEPARVEAAADFHAAQYSRNLSAANGQQATYIVTNGSAPTKDQQDQIVAQLRDKQRRIERGDFAPVFLPGGLRVEDPHARAVDAAFISQRIEHRHAIAAALGIPMSMFDVAASYSIGAASDLYRLVTFTCQPFSQKLAELLNRVEEKRAGLACYAGFRWSDHPVLQQARMERFTQAIAGWGAGIPWDVLNETLRLELPEFAGDDTAWIDFGKQPVEDALGGKLDEEPPALLEDQPPVNLLEDAKRLMNVRIVEPRAKAQSRKEEEPSGEAHVSPPTVTFHFEADAAADPESLCAFAPLREPIQLGARTKASRGRLRLWEKHMAAQKPYVRKLHSALGKVLAKYRRITLDGLPAALPTRNAERGTRNEAEPSAFQKGVIDFIFDLADFTADILGVFRGVLPKTLDAAGLAALVEMGSDEPFKTEPDWVKSYLKRREKKIEDASEETYEQIKHQVQEGIDAGDTMHEIADRVKGAFSQADKGRAQVIAQTETASAFGVARQASQEQAGITHKEWVSAQDDRVRDTHREIDGTIVAVDEPFTVNGHAMMHPCADGAPAGEVINCRCISVGSIKLSEE